MTNFTFTHRQLRVMFIALLCALFTLPLAAQNREAYAKLSDDKTTLTFFYDSLRSSKTGTIWTIERESDLDAPWRNGSKIKKMIFDASFKGFLPIKINWFKSQRKLSSIEGLENLNTSAMTDMREMFTGCSGLKELNLSSFNTSAVTDMNRMFYDCSGLKNLNLSSFNTSAVTSMYAMFSGCSSLKELNLSSFNTAAVTDMYWMFSGCSGLKELNLSNFNTSAVTDMNRMFYGCSGLKELNLSSFNTSAVTDMNSMFSYCSGLTELNLSSFNTSAVTNMGSMFYSCSGLTELNLSSFNTSAVTNMNVMFSSCSNLITIYSAGTWECENSLNMFAGCYKLKGAVSYNRREIEVRMANPRTGYFTQPKPTAIGRVGYNGNNATKVFTLQGKRVNGNTQHLPAGIYIVNGKKVYLGR